MKKITVKIPESYEGTLDGRLLFIVDTKRNSEEKECFNRVGMNGCPVFGVTFYGLEGGDIIDLNDNLDKLRGYPINFDQLPNKLCDVQAFFIKYTRYERKDGHVVYGMEDAGGGGNFAKNPYNLYSDVKTVKFGKEDIELELTHEIPLGYELKEGQVTQQGNYEDTDRIKYFKMKSELLTDFWNHDMYIGANILLPANYDPNKKYPVLYWQGHWPGNVPAMRYGVELREKEKGITEYWDSGKAPEMIAVCFRDANIFYDDSYNVNSANLGPYGDALVQEIIPAIEKQYGGLGTEYGRALAGGSTGGWESMALQLFYPDFFGGTWPMFPDGMDFHAFQIIDLYNDKNAYQVDYEYRSVERPGFRDTKGNTIWTVRDENRYELAIGGDKAHGQGQWGIWEAVYSPVGEDGYPMNVFDPDTGKINKKVVKYWHDHYDLNAYLKKNHKSIMKHLKGKIHLQGGDMDNFYLNLGQWLITETLEKYDYQGESKTYPRLGHAMYKTCIELIDEIGAYFEAHK